MSNEQPMCQAQGVLAFTLPDRDCRGRVVRLGPVLDQILSAHAYPPALAACLAEALALTALMGSLLKGEGDQLTLQAQTGTGLVRLLVCDWRDGDLRGYLELAEDGAVPDDERLSLAQLFGEGLLVITFEQAHAAERYQGIVPLEGESLAVAVENYFATSEQLPTIVRCGIALESPGSIAGGLLVQHMPQGEEGRERLHANTDDSDWNHVATLGGSVRSEELADPALALTEVIWRLFHEEGEVRTGPIAQIRRGCRCSVVHFEQVLARFTKEDRRAMADEDGIISVDCAFCSKVFAIQD